MRSRHSVITALIGVVFAGIVLAFALHLIVPANSSERPRTSGPATADKIVERARESIKRNEDLGGPFRKYLETLDNEAQLRAGRALAEDADERLKLFGIDFLVQIGAPNDAVRPLSLWIANGGDPTGLFWGWMHQRTADYDAVLTGTRSYLLTHYDEFTPEQQKRIKPLLEQ